jgi:hypothetical protein
LSYIKGKHETKRTTSPSASPDAARSSAPESSPREAKPFTRLPDRYPHEPNLWKTKTGDPNFRTAGETFSPPSTRAAPEFSHRLATCCATLSS